MKNYLIIVFLLFTICIYAQNDAKAKFQKNKYELAVSCYKKSDFKNALDLFSVASKIRPENEIGQESSKKVDTLKAILRKEIMQKALGIWRMKGDKPVWAVKTEADSKNKEVEEFIEISENKIIFYEQDKKTLVKKNIKTEDLVYFNRDKSDSLFSAIILSDGTIWNCTVDKNSSILHVINIAKQTEKGVEKIENENPEFFYMKV
ncbi:tetratricopeptide repeat protein [Flavobacterium sp. N1736]|uniref:tetratricopeptide repeat protein n=1 Tax=Flavobacterium sp. N1736 TaxID=2986823 RepID=UPI0022253DA4|nr:tetratricopeptide repeat protein [Flavobacterium sp. N1736]